MSFRTIAKVNHNARVRTVVQREIYPAEFRARVFVDGIAQEDADYYTDDRSDAYATALHMGEQCAARFTVAEAAA
jgi:hypothetical protein